MARNIELKVVCDGARHDQIRLAVAAEDGVELVGLDQIDRYYAVPNGRLKMRWGSGERPELIRYSRPDLAGARMSTYQRESFDEDQATFLDGLLIDLFGDLVTVRKHREVRIIGRTRVHIDTVADLGRFIELETVIGEDDEGEEVANIEFQNVVKLLGLNNLEVIAGSYSDLLLAKGTSQ